MKSILCLTLFGIIFLVGGCGQEEPNPELSVDKKARIEFFTASDFSDSRYNNHQVQFRAIIMKMTYDPYKTETVFDEITEWVTFKDLPKEEDKFIFETVVSTVSPKNQTVLMGYSYVIKIGEFTEMHSRNEYIDSGKSEETLKVIF